MTHDHKHALVSALLGFDNDGHVIEMTLPNTGTPEKLVALYHHNAAFLHAIDTLASMLPAMVNGLAEASRRVADQQQDRIDAAMSMPVALYLLGDGLDNDDVEHDAGTCDCETCPDCNEATLTPDDHKCPNPECPSHEREQIDQAQRLGINLNVTILRGDMTNDNRMVHLDGITFEDKLPVRHRGEQVGEVWCVHREHLGIIGRFPMPAGMALAADLADMQMEFVDGVMHVNEARLVGVSVIPLAEWAWAR